MTPIRVLLVDDHPLFREGVASLLATQRDFEVVGEVGDGRQAVEMALKLTPDVILMDISMPIMEGPEATRRIKAELPHVKVVILTVADGERRIFEALSCGAEAYILKRFEPQTLYGIVRSVVRGEVRGQRVTPAPKPPR